MLALELDYNAVSDESQVGSCVGFLLQSVYGMHQLLLIAIVVQESSASLRVGRASLSSGLKDGRYFRDCSRR